MKFAHFPRAADRTALVLAGDYLQCDWEVANMEAANCNAKTAANAILRRSGSRETPCAVSDAYRPPEWEPLKRLDEDRYRRGEANLFDGSGSTPAIRELADATAGDLARRIAAVGQAAGL